MIAWFGLISKVIQHFNHTNERGIEGFSKNKITWIACSEQIITWINLNSDPV